MVHFLVILQVGRLPLHYAANEGRLDTVRFLVVECGCPVDAPDSVSTKLTPELLSDNVMNFCLLLFN